MTYKGMLKLDLDEYSFKRTKRDLHFVSLIVLDYISFKFFLHLDWFFIISQVIFPLPQDGLSYGVQGG